MCTLWCVCVNCILVLAEDQNKFLTNRGDIFVNPHNFKWLSDGQDLGFKTDRQRMQSPPKIANQFCKCESGYYNKTEDWLF